MAATISDKLLDGAGAGQEGLSVFLYPVTNTTLVQDSGGTLRPLSPNVTLPGPFQFGKVAVSGAGGAWSATLPDSSQQSPASARWRIVLPSSGLTLEGVPPAAGTYNLGQLIAAGWAFVAGVVGVAAGSGREQSGETTLAGQSSFQINCQQPMDSANYEVVCSFQTDQTAGGTGGAPGVAWTNRSVNGVLVLLSQAHTGIMTFRLKVVG